MSRNSDSRTMRPGVQRDADEEELLHLQEQMMALKSRPSAMVTRVKRPAAEPGSEPVNSIPEPQQAGDAASLAAAPPATMADLLAAMSGIMGDVKERQPQPGEAAPAPPQPPRHPVVAAPGQHSGGETAGTAGAAAFPAAVHRKQSKFVLGRKRVQQPAEGSPSGAQASPAPATMPAVTAAGPPGSSGGRPLADRAAGRRRVSFAAEREQLAGTGAGRHGGGLGAPDERDGIDSENRQLLEAMSPQQIEEARLEVLSRLKPSALEFLQRRAASRAAPAAAQAAAGSQGSGPHAGPGSKGDSSGPGTALPGAHDPLPAGALLQAQERVPSMGNDTVPHAKASVAKATAKRPTGRPAKAETSVSSGSNTSSSSSGDASLAGLLRFDVAGDVVALKPEGAPSREAGQQREGGPQDVVRRDPIRQDEGSAGEGYTLEEACLLARSSVPQQRVMALRLLCAVLARSRPNGHNGAQQQSLVLPPAVVSLSLGEIPGIDLGRQHHQQSEQPALAEQDGQSLGHLQLSQQQQQQQQQQGCESTVGWGDVWRHALHAADVAVVLRLALDDASLAVVGAAAEAVAALVGPGEAEEAALEAADSLPLTGWPALPLRHMQRPAAKAGWVAVPSKPRRGQEATESDDDEEGADEALDEKQVAKVDPLLGLLHMDLLPRVAFVLGKARASAAIAPLLCVLIRCCQAGKDVADQVATCPGMCTALQLILDASPPPGSSADAADTASYAARPLALRLLRQLAQASKLAARSLLETGLARHIVTELFRVPTAPTPAPAAALLPPQVTAQQAPSPSPPPSSPPVHLEAALGIRVEALRGWRAFALHGLFLAHLDDAFPALCHLFEPQLELQEAGAPGRPRQQGPAGATQGTAGAGDAAGVPADLLQQQDVQEGRPASCNSRAPAGQQQAGGPAALLQSLPLQQWVAAREAYLTLAFLCRHAASCSPEEAMLSFESGCSVARQTLSWIQRLPLTQLLGECCQHVGQQINGLEATAPPPPSRPFHLSPAPSLALFRGGPGAASAAASGAVAAYVLLSTLSAALHFVAAFWDAAGGRQSEERAEACRALAKSGLLTTALIESSHDLPESSEMEHGGAGEAATDVKQGSSPGSAPPASETAGGSVAWLLQELVHLAVNNSGGNADSTSSRAGLFMTPTSVALAALELAVAAGRLEAVLSPSKGSPSMEAAPNIETPVAAAVLGPLLTRQAASCLLAPRSSASGFDATMLQPWGAADWQGTAQLARAAVAALTLVGGGKGAGSLGDMAGHGYGTTDSRGSNTSVSRESSEVVRADVASAVLCVLPPGDDSAALLALTELVSNRAACGSAGLAAGAQAFQRVEADGLGTLAGGALLDDGTQTYPCPSLPPSRHLSRLLSTGCAATWLGLVVEEGPSQTVEAASKRPTLPPVAGAVLRPEGSRLPLVGDWPLHDIPLSSSASGVLTSLPAAAGATVLLALLCEQLGVQSMAATTAEARLRSLLQLVFAPHNEAAEYGGATHLPQPRGQGAEEDLWRHPLVRWTTVALFQRYCSAGSGRGGSSKQSSGSSRTSGSTGGGSSSTHRSSGSEAGGRDSASAGGWPLVEAKALAEHFAAVSFGDAVFGAAVAMLLRRTVPLDTQLEVLQTLADEQALHLLPPLSSLPGPAAAYLDPPTPPSAPTPSDASQGSAPMQPPATGAPNGSTSTGRLEGSRKEADALVKLVVEGRLDQCLASSEEDLPAPLPLLLVVHRLVWHLFGPAAARVQAREPLVQQHLLEDQQQRQHVSSDSAAAGRTWATAALLRLVRACCLPPGTTSASGRAGLLRMLLSWDCGSAGPNGGGIMSAARQAVIPARVTVLLEAVGASGDARFLAAVENTMQAHG